jgi:hypothetical protein
MCSPIFLLIAVACLVLFAAFLKLFRMKYLAKTAVNELLEYGMNSGVAHPTN